MNNEKVNATTVAGENKNVVVESTSINNQNSNDMVEEKSIATEVAPVAEEATNETINAAENAASINPNSEKMGKKNEEVAQTTRVIIIDGEERNIIIAHTDYGMEQPKDTKDLMSNIDRTKMLSCKYHFSTPEIFWNEGIELKDENEKIIEAGTENVLVLCPTADTYWRFGLEDKIVEPEVHDFSSVQEYAQAVGCTNLYSRGLSNTEKVGVAALATGNEACKTVFLFAKKHKMNITTAKLYLDCTMKPTSILEMTMGKEQENKLTLGRKEKDAEKLLDAVTKKFNKDSGKRYIIRAINTLLRKDEYSLTQVKNALRRVTEDEKINFECATSEEKQAEITKVLTQHLEAIKREEQQKEAA